jgi:P4 family phage/plasmid primase-like protien
MNDSDNIENQSDSVLLSRDSRSETPKKSLRDSKAYKALKGTDTETFKPATKATKSKNDLSSATMSTTTVASHMSVSSSTETDINEHWTNLYAFMQTYRTQSQQAGAVNTHTMMGPPYGKFNIPSDQEDRFAKLYTKAYMAKVNMSIIERHREFGPIVLDFDFEQSKDNNKRYYTEATIRNIIRLYNKVIEKYLCVDGNKLQAYVSEKESPTKKNGNVSDGIHILYPYICTRPNVQYLMREDFIAKLAKKNVFKGMPLLNDLDKIVDKSVIYNTGWCAYGSKKPESKVYLLTHIYDCDMQEIIISKDLKKKLPSIMSIRKFKIESELTPFSTNVDLKSLEERFNQTKNKTLKLEGEKGIKKYGLEQGTFIKMVADDTMAEVKNLLALLSAERANPYQEWIRVGWCLHNIDHRLLPDWIEFSKKCPHKFKAVECERLWKGFRDRGYSIASLDKWASKDSPKKYLELRKSQIDDHLNRGLRGGHFHVAEVLVAKYKYQYKCASIKHNIWYEFMNHRWVKVENAYTLRKNISKELANDYSRMASYFHQLAIEKEGYEKEEVSNKAANVGKLIMKLNDNSFKNKVISECADLVFDAKFMERLDENPNLICFTNGVFDLEANYFREGCPDDCVSFCTGYDYVPYDAEDEHSVAIDRFLNEIMVDPAMKQYLLTIMSINMSGSIKEEKFYIMTGSGANGKSKLMELLMHTLGDYYKPMDVRILTQKRASSSSASPELADKKGIRACPLDEPNATDEVNTGFMKAMVSDKLGARPLYGEQFYFKPQLKAYLLCNSLPIIRSDDGGTWRRIRVVPFESKFIDIDDVGAKYKLQDKQFWMDKSITDKVMLWKQMFAALLIKVYHEYVIKGGVREPPIVRKYTDEYRKKCDLMQDFIQDNLIKTGDTKDNLSIGSIHNIMLTWYKQNYDGKCPPRKDLKDYISKRVEGFKDDTLFGYIFKEDQRDESKEDVFINTKTNKSLDDNMD